MPATAVVRGLRRVDLLSPDPMAAAVFYRAVLDWSPVPVPVGFDCWVGNRRCATIRKPRAGEPPGFRPVFAGAAMNYTLTGPDDAVAQLAEGRAQHGPWAPAPRSGEPCWVELATTSPQRADAFWADTLGWQVVEGEPVVYLTSGRPVATRVTERATGPGWLCYLSLPDLPDVGRLADKHGGRAEPVEHPLLPGAVLLTDPTGGTTGLTTADTWG
ncbi:hypothetical protein [Saccharopolyspora griseoalba]|uniref:Glyoxalase-like domain-containing protein n=1 Tax=Saccharopolyspora griseoalba TaxID=1431848 RepID=A0ABW2LBS9_9PSEU